MLMDEIKKAYFKQTKFLPGGYFPEHVLMSPQTFRDLLAELLGFDSVELCEVPNCIYGMSISLDDRLPDGLFVIGGLIGPLREKKE